MNLYCLFRSLLPDRCADVAYALFCAIAFLLIFMFWPAKTTIFAYLRL